jgi:hypothetical protein
MNKRQVGGPEIRAQVEWNIEPRQHGNCACNRSDRFALPAYALADPASEMRQILAWLDRVRPSALDLVRPFFDIGVANQPRHQRAHAACNHDRG